MHRQNHTGTVVDIAAWLRELGLERYEEAFRESDVDTEILPKLTADDLKDIGVTSVGHRRKLLEAIAILSRPAEAQQAGTSTPADAAVLVRPTDAERRQLTVLFCDLVGSTELSARVDPEDLRDIMRTYQDACAAVLKRWDGHVAKYLGDGVLAYFGWPVAHEDDAERAVRAGLELVAAVGQLTADGSALAARIGIATGRVVVGDLIGEGASLEEAVVGETPNLAARLQGLASPGQVVTAKATRQLLGANFELEDLGECVLKGISEPLQAFAVAGERATPSRFEARSGALLPMVGRNQELALLMERWSLAKAGEGQGVLLVGEAGIGKSRIGRALLDAVAEEPHLRIRYQCSPYHTDSALWPVIQQLTQAAGFVSHDRPEARLDKLEALLARADGDTGGAAALIADLIGLDHELDYGGLDLTPQARRMRTLEALFQQLLGLAAQQPVLLMLEDAHWIDPTTQELIEQCLDRIAAARVLILVTSRPDQQPALAGHPHVTRLTLNRLSRGGVEAIVARLGGDRLPTETIETIIARTDGVPLFVEELTQAVLETGEATVPASLHDSLMARLDRIPEVKEVAQTAACIGRGFDFSLLAAVANQPEAELATALDKLTAADLIFRRGTPPQANYTFKHTLVCDAAYDSLLKSRRRAVHARIAGTLEAWSASGAEVSPVELAHHHLLADAPEWALEPLQRAAERAAAVGAAAEAVAHYDKVLDLLVQLPDRGSRRPLEAELLLGLGIQTQLLRGAGSAEPETIFSQALELAAGEACDRIRFSAAWNLWRVRNTRGDFDKARTAASDLTLIGRDTGEAELVLQAHHASWTTLEDVGDVQAALDHVERARRDAADVADGHAAQFAGHDAWVCGAGTAAKVHLLMGRMTDAEKEIRGCLSRAERLGDGGTLGNALHNAITYGLLRRDRDFLPPIVQKMLELSEPEGLQDLVAFGRFARGWTAARDGAADEGETDMRAAIALAEAAGRMFEVPFWLVLLVETLAAAGRLGEADELSSKALEQIAHSSAGTIRESEVLRIRGNLVARCGRRGEAIRHLEKAIAVARHSGARLLELRAAISLARLWVEQGGRQEALDLLAPIYDWFTEGFDTADLKDAKALLEQLG